MTMSIVKATGWSEIQRSLMSTCPSLPWQLQSGPIFTQEKYSSPDMLLVVNLYLTLHGSWIQSALPCDSNVLQRFSLIFFFSLVYLLLQKTQYKWRSVETHSFKPRKPSLFSSIGSIEPREVREKCGRLRMWSI